MPQLASSLARDRWGGEEKVEILKQARPVRNGNGRAFLFPLAPRIKSPWRSLWRKGL